jgi:hypothetical protein
MTTAQKKDRLVHKILSNPTYTGESGLYQRLTEKLTQWSVDDLSSLLLILELKEQFAAENPARWTE